MQLDRIRILAKREYLSRIKTVGFWLGTLALPMIMVAAAFLPALLLSKTETSLQLVVVDGTGGVGAALEERLEKSASERATPASFEVEVVPLAGGAEAATAQRAGLDRRVLAGEIDAWLWVTEESLAEDQLEYHAESVSNFVTLAIIERAAAEVVRRARFRHAGLDAERVAELSRSVGLETVRVSEGGSRSEGAEAGMIFAYVLFFLLYMVLILYGAQVLNGVLEEKTSRVVEVVVSTVRPFELMMGKLIGIGATGLTQLGIWFGTMAVVSAPAVVGAMTWLPEGFEAPRLTLTLAVNFFLFFVLGYFLYASFYAAVGAAFNNLQEAQQVASVIGFLFIVPAMFFMPVLNDPDSTTSVVSSLVPPLTPLIMMLRVAVKTPPLWQLLLSYVLTIAFTIFMVWVAARIYRVGILMYGKKPTFQELWRWLRYA